MTAQLKMMGLNVKEPHRPLFIMNMYFMSGAITFFTTGKRLDRPWSLWVFETFISSAITKATIQNCATWSGTSTRLGMISTST